MKRFERVYIERKLKVETGRMMEAIKTQKAKQR